MLTFDTGNEYCVNRSLPRLSRVRYAIYRFAVVPAQAGTQ